MGSWLQSLVGEFLSGCRTSLVRKRTLTALSCLALKSAGELRSQISRCEPKGCCTPQCRTPWRDRFTSRRFLSSRIWYFDMEGRLTSFDKGKSQAVIRLGRRLQGRLSWLHSRPPEWGFSTAAVRLKRQLRCRRLEYRFVRRIARK